ncbi:MAG: RND family transporter [Candidatus Pelagibacterales bacterium]
MKKVFSSVLDNYSKLSLFLLVAVAFFFLFSSDNFQLDASSDTLILEQDDDLKRYQELIKDYDSSDFLIVTFTSKQKFIKRENLNFLNSFINEIDKLPFVDSTQSIFDAPLLEINNQSLSDLVNEIITIKSPQVNIVDAEIELLNSPIFKNLIISEDATTTGLLINLKKNLDFNAIVNERIRLNELNKKNNAELELLSQLDFKYEIEKKKQDKERENNILTVRTIIEQFEDKNIKIHLGGVSMIANDTIAFVKNDIIIFGIGAFIFILIVLYLVFRSPLWMIACIANCIFILTIMIGSISLLGWKVTVISSNFIMLILILSLSMTVHIVVRYRQISLEEEKSTINQNIIRALGKMYKPCLFAALTTIFAFGSLYTSGIKPVMDFGLMMCIGLTITYVSSFIFLPILISVLNLKGTALLEKNNNKDVFSFLSIRFPLLTLLFFTSLFAVGVYGASTLKVENSFVNYFKEDTEIYKGMKLIDEQLGGTTPLDIIIQFKDDLNDDFSDDEEDFMDFGIDYDPADYWFTKEKIDNVKSIHDYLETYDFVGKVLSLASIIRTAEKLNSNEEFDTLELSVLYKKLPQDIKDQILKPYVLIGKNQARISLRVIDTHPELKRADFVNELKEHMESNYNNQNIEVSLTGILILYNNMLQSLFDSQIKSLGIVLMGIFIILIILFRSFKIALAALTPNLVACFVILGTMGLLNIPLDLMTITIASITIGIAVDNCIHYVYRYREYILITGSHADAVNNCQKTVSTAIKNTSITIMAGFSILVFSNFYPTIYFGAFTALAMLIALIGSLTILPILLGYFNKNS